ncbi:sialate O-acetylesterase [Dyadobacter luteus]|nr:sialate O-acetylesterase [Dyadobacter luteus]
MMKMIIASLVGLLIATFADAQRVPKDMDLYLLIGQSNMAGRGKPDGQSEPKSDKIWVIDSRGEWVIAQDPLHYDKPAVVGVGPGLSFAQAVLAAHPNRPIGLIPCAVGGSGIDDWVAGRKHEQTGIYAYDAMKSRVAQAVQNGSIKGILWHQGESDSDSAKAAVYKEKLTAFFSMLRKELKVKRTPLVVGTLGDFYVVKNPTAALINQIVTEYATSTKNTSLAIAAGLTDIGDATHFDTKSEREIGKRYAEAFLKMRK